jgi:carbon monoxide dehydrogenase subunit G
VKANVGGKLAQIGSRLVDAAAKKVADEFFKNFNDRMSSSRGRDRRHAPGAGSTGTRARRTSTAAMPTVSNTTLIFFAAGSLVVFVVALVTLLG